MANEDEDLLDRLQHGAFDYIVDNANPENGLVADTSRPDAPCSIAVVGFALSCYPVAVERGWMSRAAALDRASRTLRFFRDSPRGTQPEATGYHGFYYHFLDMRTGRRAWRSEVSVIDTALLLAGVLCVASYFQADTPAESALRDDAGTLYRRVNWGWARGGEATPRQGWTPEDGFLHDGWDGYDEAALMYVLGLASPTFPLDGDGYRQWTSKYEWKSIYGVDFLYAGPLFIHQFSHAWIDFRGIQDGFMREKNSDYFENSQRAIAVQREYARRNPLGFTGYHEDCWGLTATQGPGPLTMSVAGRDVQMMGYAARGAPYGPDDGTLAPCAAVASLPFAPQAALAAVRHIETRYPDIMEDDRLPSGFNPTLAGSGPSGWVSDAAFGLDQGLLVMMIENHRSGLIWRLMRDNPTIRLGLTRAGYTGGWLSSPPGVPSTTSR